MSDESRLYNVKECCKLLLNFLNEKDFLTLITFGDSSKVVLSAVRCSEREHLAQVIGSLRVDGCTNLSAGIAQVRTSLDDLSEEVRSCKQGLLVLTDGHANRGLTSADAIRELFQNLRASFSGLSIHSVGYGANHNADLLRGIAEQVSGSYNVVNKIEDTAFAFGDTVGGLMSCYFQNARLKVPDDSMIHGPLSSLLKAGEVPVGDVYSGVKQLYLLDIPVEVLRIHGETPCVRLEGMRVPSLESVVLSSALEAFSERDTEAELTKLRYECSDLLKVLSDTRDDRIVLGLKRRVDAFESALNDEAFTGNSLCALLKAEIPTLRTLLDQISRQGHPDVFTTTTAYQHSAYVGLARGFSTPMAPGRTRRRSSSAGQQEENPTNITGANLCATTSVFQNSVQATMSAVMATASQSVAEAHNQ